MKAQALKFPKLSEKQHSQGVVLIITLLMMLLITLTTLTSIRAVLIEEKMAGHARDRNKAQQAAEAALRACLQLVIDNDPIIIGKKQTPASANETPVWEDHANWNDSSKTADLTTLRINEAQIEAKPRCMLEELPSSGISYRITSRALGGSEDTVVLLQANYTNE